MEVRLISICIIKLLWSTDYAVCRAKVQPRILFNDTAITLDPGLTNWDGTWRKIPAL
jgi:hypothetical protein